MTVCLFQSALFIIAVLIEAIVKNGSSTSAGADHIHPPPGWRDEDIGRSETVNTSSDEKKTYTEEQRQGVTRCKIFYIVSPQQTHCVFLVCNIFKAWPTVQMLKSVY